MVLWCLVEVVVSAVGAYNIAKGAYNMYCDAETVKNQYREYQQTTDQYRRVQTVNPSLTESQYQKYESEFVVLKSK